MNGKGYLRRLLLFALLGPPLGMAAGFFIIIPLLSGFQFPNLDLFGFLVLMPASYIMGLVPALLAGMVDAVLADRGTSPGTRIAYTAIAGFFIGFIPIFAVIVSGYANSPFLLLYGIIGAVPAAICSWLAGRKKPVTA